MLQAPQTSTPDQRLHLVLHELETGVANGGLATYLANTAGEQLAEAAEGLAELGAEELLGIVETVARPVPPGAR